MMGTNKLDNGEKAPPLSSILQENDFAFTNWQKDAANSTEIFYNGSSARADPMSFSYMPFQIAPFPGKHMHGTCQPNAHNTRETCGNLMVDLNELHNLQTPQIDLNSINIGNNIPCMYGQDLQYPDWNVKGVLCTRDKTGTADNVVNDTVHFNSFQNPAINRKFPLIKGNIHGAYEMTRQGGEVDMSNIYGPQILNVVGSGGSRTYKTQNCNGPQIRNFVGLGGSRTCNTQNTEEIGNENNDEVCTARFGCPEKIDGSFLSLGIGSNTKAKSKADHISREITGGELYGAVSPVFNTSCVQQGTGRSLNLGHDFIGGLSSFQNNGFTSLGNHMGRTSSYNNMGVVSGTSASLNSSQFHTLQRPQADIQRRFPTSGTGNQGNVGARDASYPNLDAYKSFMGKQAASAAPCVNSSTGLLDSGQTGASEFASESVKLVWTAQPTSDQLQKHLTETVQNFLPESSMDSSFIRCKGSSTRQEHSVQLFSASKDSAAQAVDGSARPPTRKRVQPAGQLFSAANDLTAPYGSVGGLFPKRIGVQVNKDGAAQAAGGAPFPQRLGEHVNERRAVQAAGAGLFHRSTGIQATNCHVSYAAECGQYTKEIGVQTATKGQPQLFSADHRGPSFPTGQEISTAKRFGLSQASKVLGVPPPPPSLKRSAIRPPPATPRVQRSKIMLPPPIHPSMLSAYAARAALVPYPATLHHIRWKGFDGLPQPLGQKCMLCKRDLSFTPEGPVHQPTVPPAVAVLSCGHTFHDHCLQNLTPEDQSKDPPCIPCAIGEI